MLERISAYAVIAWLQLTARLPQSLARAMSYPGGLLLELLMRRRAAIVTANLQHCFPAWSAAQLAGWRRRMFQSLAYSFYEIAISWCRRDSQ